MVIGLSNFLFSLFSRYFLVFRDELGKVGRDFCGIFDKTGHISPKAIVVFSPCFEAKNSLILPERGGGRAYPPEYLPLMDGDGWSIKIITIICTSLPPLLPSHTHIDQPMIGDLLHQLRVVVDVSVYEFLLCVTSIQVLILPTHEHLKE